MQPLLSTFPVELISVTLILLSCFFIYLKREKMTIFSTLSKINAKVCMEYMFLNKF